MQATDSAGTPGKVLVVELERPYPGPGMAAAMLTRRGGIGRTQDVTALARWDVTPGMEASISLPGALAQIGQVESVTWQLDDGLMKVGTRGLTEASAGTWLWWPAADTWDTIDPALEWKDA